MQEGDCFDLGGVHAEIFELPGHTQGSIVVLIPEDGVLITGDAANTMTWMFLPESSTVKEYQNALISIQEKLKGRYQRIFTCHRNVDVDPDLIDQAIQVCSAVLQSKDDAIPYIYMDTDVRIAENRKDLSCLDEETSFNMAYRTDQVQTV